MTNDIYTQFENFVDIQYKLNNYTTKTVKTTDYQIKAAHTWIMESGTINKISGHMKVVATEGKYHWAVKNVLEAYYPNGVKGFLKTYAQMRAIEVLRLKKEESFSFSDISSHLGIKESQAEKLYQNALSIHS